MVDFAETRLSSLILVTRLAKRFHWHVLALFIVLRIVGVIQTGWRTTLLVMVLLALSDVLLMMIYGAFAGLVMGREYKRRREED